MYNKTFYEVSSTKQNVPSFVVYSVRYFLELVNHESGAEHLVGRIPCVEAPHRQERPEGELSPLAKCSVPLSGLSVPLSVGKHGQRHVF